MDVGWSVLTQTLDLRLANPGDGKVPFRERLPDDEVAEVRVLGVAQSRSAQPVGRSTGACVRHHQPRAKLKSPPHRPCTKRTHLCLKPVQKVVVGLPCQPKNSLFQAWRWSLRRRGCAPIKAGALGPATGTGVGTSTHLKPESPRCSPCWYRNT